CRLFVASAKLASVAPQRPDLVADLVTLVIAETKGARSMTGTGTPKRLRSAIVGAVGCLHERGHITDSQFYGHSYATTTSRRIFCDMCRHQRWLDVEASLALAQADLGVLPAAVAADIVDSARLELLDTDEIRQHIRHSGHSLVGLLRAFQAACSG